MTKKNKDDTVGPWAKEKLDALRQYPGFYTTVLKNQGHWLQGTIFVDAFAGPSLSRVRIRAKTAEPPGLFGPDPESDAAEIEYLEGSPRVALDIANPFTSYLFIDRDPEHAAKLTDLKARYASTHDIAIQEGDASAALGTWLASGIDWKHYRAVVFLDPFGMQMPWSTVEMLAGTKAIEVIINTGYPLRSRDVNMLGWRTRHPIPKAGSTTRAP